MTLCAHGYSTRCPWPGCPAGVAGARRVVCGIEGPKYFARALDVVPILPSIPTAGRLEIRWTEVREGACET